MSIDFNAAPYWDDFEATNGALENNYMRILFRPGYAVQARELTQIQSIVQNQIKQFGNHVFQDGSPVIGGHLTLDTSAVYIKLDKQFGGSDIDLDNFLSVTVYNSTTPKTRARVVQTYSDTTDRTLMVKYLRGSGFQAGQTITTAGTFFNANIASPNFTGTGSVVTINEGVFYVSGFFVKVPQQTIVLEPYSATPTYRVGLEIDENIITESEDTALLDPAQESFNYQAPGATRYQFNLVLTKRAIDSVDDSRFFELLRVENGVITRQVNYPIYSELEKTLARRTYDESGNYVVKPFRINLSANTPAGAAEDANTFIINIEPGKAYVKGFEFETIGTQKLSAPRARTFKDNKNYNLSAYYGNSIELTNVLGSSDGVGFSQDLKEVDIHCVSNNFVILNGNTHNYYATRIGSAKIKNFDRVDTENYKTYLIDINFAPMVGEASANSLYFDEIYLPSYYSSNTGAYVDGVITMLTGNSAGESAIITNYNGNTKLAALATKFTNQITTGEEFSISIPITAAESFIRPNTSTFLSANLQANVSINSKDIVGAVSLQDTSFNSNLFELPNYYIRYDSDDNVDLYRRYIRRVSFGGGNGSYSFGLAGPDQGKFDFGTDGQLVSDADVDENIIVIPVTGANTGQILDLTIPGRSVYRVTDDQIVINTANGSGATFDADVFVTVKLSSIEDTRRTKTLVQSNSALTTLDNPSGAVGVSGYTNVKINAANGIAWYTTSDVIAKLPGEKQSLFVSDVVRIKKVYDSANISHAPNTTNMVDITDRYVFDSGQNDNYYDHASITLKPGSSPPKGQTAVLFDYFTHAGLGYLSAKSYAETLYNNELIPIYKSQNGITYNLRDSIDLRPIRDSGLVTVPLTSTLLSPTVNVASGGVVVSANTAKTANILNPPITTGSMIRIGSEYRKVTEVQNSQAITISAPLTGGAVTDGALYLVTENKEFGEVYIQRPTDPIELDYSYYLPRIDKVIITKDKQFKLLSGIPSLAPEEPVVNEDAIAIYKLNIPAYTASHNSIDAEYVDNRRYTMRDISDLDERLTSLEKFVFLKDSEANIINNPPKSPVTPTINKPIYGTLVDDFNDLGKADTNNDFAASIENGRLTCYKNVTGFKLKALNDADNSIQDKFVTLEYTEVPAVSQKNYTPDASAQVQTSIIGKFEGFLTLTPESDYFYSTEHQPSITDTLGRFFELRQNSVGGYGAITSTLIQALGGNQYTNLFYNNPLLVGDYEFIGGSNKIFIPDPSINPGTIEPTSVVPININFLGAAPETFLNKTWTGNQDMRTPIGNPNSFVSGWRENSYLISGSGLSDSFFSGRYNNV